jgi:hypothetical protein
MQQKVKLSFRVRKLRYKGLSDIYYVPEISSIQGRWHELTLILGKHPRIRSTESDMLAKFSTYDAAVQTLITYDNQFGSGASECLPDDIAYEEIIPVDLNQ